MEPGLLVTNQHVVASESLVTVRQATGGAFLATVVATDSVRDVALLQYDVNAVQLHVAAKPFVLGQVSISDLATPLMALGYSGNIGVKGDGTVGVVPANLGGLAGIIDFGTGSFGLNLVIDAPVDPGDTGGPVLDPDGELVGMVRATLGTSDGRHIGSNYSVHVDEIRDALVALRAGQSQ